MDCRQIKACMGNDVGGVVLFDVLFVPRRVSTAFACVLHVIVKMQVFFLS